MGSEFPLPYAWEEYFNSDCYSLRGTFFTAYVANDDGKGWQWGINVGGHPPRALVYLESSDKLYKTCAQAKQAVEAELRLWLRGELLKIPVAPLP